ncbi:MAG: hypothetical protein M1817_006182 [Caeruleum heppii]|nr:MAG: hypothetical protein M1817_006182 [Caeruleum heppii]
MPASAPSTSATRIAGQKGPKPIRSRPPSSTSPAYSSLFLTNLRLLDLGQLHDWPEDAPQAFTTHEPHQNLKARIKCIEWALYRLFELYAPQETREKLSPFFPPLVPLQSLNLRAALFRCLSELKKNGSLGRDTVLRKSMLDECTGERFEEILALFSALVLKHVLTGKDVAGGIGSVVRRLVTATRLSEYEQPMLEPLIITHRAALTKILRERNTSAARYREFDGLLRQAETRQAQREEKLEQLSQTLASETLPTPAESNVLERQLRENCFGDERWSDLILQGGSENKADPLLDLSPATVWENVESGKSHDLQTSKSQGLLEDLDSRVHQLNRQLHHWKACRAKFTPRSDKSTEKLQEEGGERSKTTRIDFGFGAHTSLQLPREAERKAGSKPSMMTAGAKTHGDYPPDGEYARLVNAMRAELAAVGKTRHRGDTEGRHVERPQEFVRKALETTALPKHSHSGKPTQKPNASSSVGGPGNRRGNYEERKSSPTPATDEKRSTHDQAHNDGNLQMPVAASGATEPLQIEEASISEPHARQVRARSPEARGHVERDGALEEPTGEDVAVDTSVKSSSKVKGSPPKAKSKESRNARLSLLSEEDRELLAEQIVSSVVTTGPSPAKKPPPSLTARTRMSMAFSRPGPLDSLEEDDVPPLPSQNTPNMRHESDGTNESSDQPSPAIEASTLVQRTRQSMSVPAHRRTSRAPLPPKHVFPTNQFETPIKSKPQQETPSFRSRSPTPREELFGQEADYASVFKSRPKINISPHISPERGEGISEVIGEDDEGSEDSLELRKEWEDSPLGRIGRR